MKQSEDEIETLLLPIWPTAKILGYRTRSAAYDAVARGDILVVKLGKRILRVPKRWVERKTSGDEAA
jgi:hypothetical protein